MDEQHTPPGKPGLPQIIDYDKDWVELKWQPPAEDGGAPITGYIIERRAAGGEWTKATEIKGATNKGSCKGLVEGKIYEFRVKAVNKAGAGKPSDSTTPHKAKPKNLKPKIDRTNLVAIAIKTGKSVTVEVDIRGEPPPKVTWSFKGKEVSDEKITVTNIDYHTSFKLTKATRAHSGAYTITATNESGTDEAILDITVLGKPGKPKGPLNVDKVHKKGCSLNWKPPDDDGGTPIECYEIEKMEEGTGRWDSCGRTQGKQTSFDVTDLTPGKKYLFRVKAVNKEGDSDPLETTKSTLAKDPYDEPGKPGRPNVTDYDTDWVELAWTPPDNDGGAPITGYIIEKKAKNELDWSVGGEVKEPVTKGACKGLIEGQIYEFRVKAVNKAGPGAPSDASPPHKAKPKNLKPRIDRTNLKPITVKVGKPINLEVDIIGEPPPEVKWFLKGQPVSNDGNVTITNVDYHTSLKIEKATRAHSSGWTIVATNASGKDEAVVEITVLGKPSKPGGPLVASGVHDEGCTLEWKPPEDDGGTPIECYEIEKFDVETGRWVRCGKTKGKETKFEVDGLTKGKKYKFRVKAVNKEGDSEALETDSAVLAKNPYDEPGKPGTPVVADYDTDFVQLKWDPPKSDGGAPITGYIIEKRVAGGPWVKGADIPGNVTTGKCDGLIDGQVYEFRVLAVNKAGPGEPSDASSAHRARPKNLKPKIDRTNLNKVTVKTGKPVNLEVGVKGEPPPTITWIFKGKNVPENDATYQIKNDEYHTSFNMKNSTRAQSGTYIVKAENANGVDEAEVEINVLDKPGKPEGPLSVSNVYDQGCTLEWKPPEDDGGCPIECYEIEKMDVDTGRWVRCGKTNGKETSLDVKGLIPGKKYKFRVKAVNPEGTSDPLETATAITAKNPYEEPGKPGTPEIADYDNTWVELKWTPPMNDGGAPITGYIVEKRQPGGNWQKADEVYGNTPKTRVDGLIEGNMYEFRVKAVNKAGPGKPSDATQPHKAKYKNLKPYIDRTNLNPIIVKVGKPINVEVDVRGEPPPKITWTFKGQKVEVTPDGNLSIDTSQEYHTSFAIKKGTRALSGAYTITAENVNGKDEAVLEVTILGKPSKPRGPLETSNVTKDSCTLSWQAPEDDGGTPIQCYEIEKLDVETGRWVRCGVADGKDTTFDVKGLTPGHRYKFRVKAVNKEGDSEELETSHSILAKDPFDEPGKPGIPEVVDYDKNFVDLKWTPPANDGGAPITGYIIEKRVLGGDWTPGGEVMGNQTKGTVKGLIEGQLYEFRVKAVNKAGPGKPSDASSPHKAKPKNLKPYIDRTNLNPITVKVGRSINVEVDIRGEPPPKVTWTFKGKPAEGDGNLLITSVDYHTTFTLEKAKRLYSGDFIITATNASGTDEAVLSVTVLGKPSKPQGPLDISNVHKEGCTLKWKPPEDDGGCPIECYEIEKMDEETGQWVPCGKSTDTQFEVKNLVPGHKYKFRVRAVNKEGDSEELEADKAIIAKNEFDEPGKPGRPVPTDWDKDHVDLKWTAPADTGGTPIIGYVIEKRKKGTHKWIKGAQIKGDVTEGTCPGLEEGEEYEFRVIAVNKEGPGEPSDPSASVVAKPRKLAPSIDRSNLQPVVIRVGQPVKFDVGVTGEPPPTIVWSFAGKPLQSGEGEGGGVTTIQNDPNHSMIMLTKTTRLQSGIYTITATNPHGKDEAQVEIKVVGKPSPPKGPLEVSDVHAEGCKLKWEKPEDDGGTPISGYVVEKMDTETGMWVPVTTTKDPEATVTGLVPGKKYKFRVKAVNNEGESDPLESEKEILAKNPFDEPGKPGNLQATNWGKRHVDLKWESPKDNGGSPITGYIIEKKDIATGKWVKCATVDGDVTEARVSDLMEGGQYQFRVKAVNKAGPGKPSDPTECPFSPPGPPGTPRSIDSTPDSITLTWSKPKKDGGSPVTGYVLEKRVAGEDKWTRVPGNITDNTFKVTGLQENQNYEFRVAGVNSAGVGQYSECSDAIKAQYPPSAPRIDPSFRLKDIVVMAGEKFSLRVPFTGTPKPKAEWTVNGEMILPADRIVSEVNADFVIFTNKKSKRTDSGNYTLKLSNSEGYDTCSCRVLVIDKPGPPQGPIEVTDVTPETCSLSWKPPLDDGGSPITNYIVEKREATSGNWVKVSGFVRNCHYDVIGLEPNKKYFFRIRAENQYGVSDPLDTDTAITAKFPFNVPDPPGQPKAIDYDANAVTLTWDRPNHDGGSRIQGYQVEYCDPTDGRWVVANPQLCKECTLTVTALMEHKEYKFRVKAKNAAGFSQPSQTSNLIKIRPKCGPPSPPQNLRVIKIGKTYADLKWDRPRNDGGSKITAYVVERRQVGSGHWLKVNDYGCLDCEYTVLNLIEQTEYDFRVSAVNDAGRSEPCQTMQPVRITEIEGGSKPEFVRKLFNRSNNIHGCITFECEAIGKPTPTARWFKNGRELVPGQTPPRYKMTAQDGVFKLVIEDIQEGDEADYTCEAGNPLGSDR